MIKRVLTILFLVLANSVLLGHSIIIHHHHYHHGASAVEGILHYEHASEHFHHEKHDNSIEHKHDIPEHCHLFSNNEYYSTYINQLDLTKRIEYSIDYILIGFEHVELNKLPETKYLNYDLIRFTKSLCKQGALALRGPPTCLNLLFS